MTKIKSIALNLPMNDEWYAVGEETYISQTEKGMVTAIVDDSISSEQNYVPTYVVYVNERPWKRIENSPVSITYFLEGSK